MKTFRRVWKKLTKTDIHTCTYRLYIYIYNTHIYIYMKTRVKFLGCFLYVKIMKIVYVNMSLFLFSFFLSPPPLFSPFPFLANRHYINFETIKDIELRFCTHICYFMANKLTKHKTSYLYFKMAAV